MINLLNSLQWHSRRLCQSSNVATRTLNHLKLLIELNENESLSDTARTSHTTQPELSKWLKELEDDIGAPLFERHSRGLRTTPMGKLFIEHARRMTTEVARAQHNLEAFQEGSSQLLP